MRHIKLAFIFLALANVVFGQEEEPLHPKFDEENCRPPSLVAKAVIHYELYSKAYLELDAVGANQKFNFQSLEGDFSQEVISSTPTILLSGLPTEKLFAVETLDDCGDTVVVATISTKAEDADEHGIEVSARMFKAITDFQDFGDRD